MRRSAGGLAALGLILTLTAGGLPAQEAEPVETDLSRGPEAGHGAEWTGEGVEGDAERIRRVGNELMCLCGTCNNLTLGTCSCGFADEQRAEMQRLFDEGRSDAEVLAWFVTEWGEQIRSKPTTRGFNLLAWVLPFAGLLGGSLLLLVILRRWKGAPAAPAPPAAPAMTPEERARYEERVERELEEHQKP